MKLKVLRNINSAFYGIKTASVKNAVIHIADYYCWKIMDKDYEVKLYMEVLNEYKISEVKYEEVISELITRGNKDE